MICRWAAGDDVDADGRRLDAFDRWQPRLFRALRDRLGAPSPAERLPELEQQLRAGALDLDVPGRLSLFGFTMSPGGAEIADLVDAVATGRDVRCFLHDPSPATDPATWTGLLHSWGVGAAARRDVVRSLDDRIDVAVAGPAAPPDSLLGRLQHSVIGGTPYVRPAGSSDDTSIRIHGAQGTRRQVEVLRDAICARFAADPTLGEDDIVVCCGDLERFTPLIHTVLGGAGSVTPVGSDGLPAGTPVLRYRIDDAAGRPDNPVETAVRSALELATGRFSALDVVEFCGLEAVRRRWGFDDDDLGTIRRWIAELDVRWGYDVDQRAAQGVSASIIAGTWRRALDRLALGVAFARDDIIVSDNLVPAGVEGAGIEVLGRLVDLVTRLAELSRRAAESMPIVDRLRRLEIDLEALVATDEGADWQLGALRRMCRVHFDDGESVQEWVGDLATTLVDLRPELLQRLDGGGRRSGAFRGGITITSPQGLAGVPFRVVCLLGLDDGAVPGSVRDGDDLMALSPQPGDPDPRVASLGAYLAAIGAATEALEVFHDVRDLATNQSLADSVPLAELWAEILTVCEHPDIAASQVRLSHPRHGTDDDCFVPGAIVPGVPWSFDPLALAGAKARASRGSASAAGHIDALVTRADTDPRASDGTVALSDLAAFIENPARFLCRSVLDVRLPAEDDEFEAHLRTGLDNLESYDVRQTLLMQRLARSDHLDTETVERLLTARDSLPVGVLGETMFAELDGDAALLADVALELRADGHDTALPVRVELADGRELIGTVTGRRHADGVQVFSASAARMKTGTRLRSWTELLALTATYPEESFESVLDRRPATGTAKKAATSQLRLRDTDFEVLVDTLGRLVQWFDAFCHRPAAVSVECFTSRLIAGGGEGCDGLTIDKKIISAWDSACRYSSELVFLAADQTLAAIVADPASPGEPGDGHPEGRVAAFLSDIDSLWSATVGETAGKP
ncbi:MAG TPA: hypothetical protein VFN21_01020, partial [Acidimicrobiales bacterium]|nr:hypothetical protein [Acidimicrobiales bacterium]